jgi:hypothetical protein
MALAPRVLAFAGLPFLSLLTPFLLLPILARVAGAEAWLAIAIGQSVGADGTLVDLVVKVSGRSFDSTFDPPGTEFVIFDSRRMTWAYRMGPEH